MVKKKSLGSKQLSWMKSTKEENTSKSSKTEKRKNISKSKHTEHKEITKEAEEVARATFIIKESILNKLRNIAYTRRESITAVLEEFLERCLKSYKGEIIERPDKKK